MQVKVVLFIVVASAIAIQAGVVPNSRLAEMEAKGFKLLGSVKKTRVVDDAEILEDWNYWESTNAAGYSEAARDCRANGDTLLYLETSEEVDDVNRWLQDTDNSGSLYWTGGKYDLKTGNFTWDNGVPFLDDAPWASGEPRLKKPNTRVAATAIGREIELKTQANTVTSRYICEGP